MGYPRNICFFCHFCIYSVYDPDSYIPKLHSINQKKILASDAQMQVCKKLSETELETYFAWRPWGRGLPPKRMLFLPFFVYFAFLCMFLFHILVMNIKIRSAKNNNFNNYLWLYQSKLFFRFFPLFGDTSFHFFIYFTFHAYKCWPADYFNENT